MDKNKTSKFRIEELFDLCDEGWFCQFADFDCKEPYIELGNIESLAKERKILIPETIAYYLRTHWCGSHTYHDTVEKMAKNELRASIKEILKEESIHPDEVEQND